MGKLPTQKLDVTEDLTAWGTQPESFAALQAHLAWKNFELFTFIEGGQFSLPKRANNGSPV